MTSLLNASFPVLWYRGLKSHSSDCSTFLWSTCIQAGWYISHREKKSCTSIESCQRILYFKIVHCRLRGISMPLLTHVAEDDHDYKKSKNDLKTIFPASDCVVEDLERTGVLPPTLFRWRSPFTLSLSHSNKKWKSSFPPPCENLKLKMFVSQLFQGGCSSSNFPTRTTRQVLFLNLQKSLEW